MNEEVRHQAVVSSLLDLQARLRGDGAGGAAEQAAPEGSAVDVADPQDAVRVPEAAPIFVNFPDGAVTPVSSESVSVAEGDVIIEVASDEGRLASTEPDAEEIDAPVTQLFLAADVPGPVELTESPEAADVPDAPRDTRLADLTERLARLEHELEGVLGKLEQLAPARPDRPDIVLESADAGSQDLDAAIATHLTELQRFVDERIHGTED
jgi:hypothetical protein